MNKMKQAYISPRCNMYMLQPGDATRYRFSIIDFADAKGVMYENNEFYGAGFKDVIRGVGYDHVAVVIHSPSIASFELSLAREFDWYYFSYIMDHAGPSANRYTVCAVILAVKSLCDSDDIYRACNEMLKTEGLLVEWDAEREAMLAEFAEYEK